MSLCKRAPKLSLTALLLAAAALVAVLVALAPPAGSTAQARPRVAGLTDLRTCKHLRNYLAKHRRAYAGGPIGMPVAGDVGAPSPAGEGTGYAPMAPDESSPTNVQETGVDEPDVVKTSGSVIFTVDGTMLRAVDTSSGTPILVGRLALPDGAGDQPSVGSYQLLAAGDRLLAIGSSYGYAIPFEADASTAPGEGVVAPDIAYPTEPRVWIAEIDISEPSAMRVLRTEKLDGSFVSARLTGSTVRLVTSTYPAGPITAAGKARKVLPETTVRDRTTHSVRHGHLGGCGSVSRPSRFSGVGMLSVSTIDLERGLPAVDADTIFTDGQIVYASPTALYVSTERWLDPAEPSAPSGGVVTEIHRFDTSDPESTTYEGSGSVAGFMLSQWSISEQAGVLRVASTTAPPFDQTGQQQGESESFITDLVPDGGKLTRVGRVGGLGRGEQIYAVRFAGDVGYVVTFRQVDPLYTVDLSDPADPRVVGELKIPGYSAYLHPVGDGLLLGVGQDADSSGRTTGLQASLYDVSDPAHPVRVDSETFGAGASSEVEFDHHAFAWFAGDSLAVLPMDSYYATTEFHGAVGLRVTAGGADPLGRVAKVSRGSGYGDSIRRSLELGGHVYTVASTGIDEYDPATMAKQGSLDY